MCGITGMWSSAAPIEEGAFSQMTAALKQRGPDGQAHKLFAQRQAALGHTRLSIIDLSEKAAQPLPNEDGSLWLSCNGEIYNYRSLRRELIAAGHRFYSQCDSEVVLHGYEEWGAAVLQRLRGIFAFAIYDVKKHTFFLARDPIGVKPLYFYRGSSTFLFASEPKAFFKIPAFRQKVNRATLPLFLAYGHLPNGHSIYENVEQLLPGHYLEVVGGKPQPPRTYWQLRYNPVITEPVEAIKQVHDKIGECIKLQCVADVPIGVLLSGGVDSTLIAAQLQAHLPYPVHSFNMGFDVPASDESPFAAQAARAIGTVHHSGKLTFADTLPLFHELARIFEEPFLFTSLFPYLQLARQVRGQGHKVVMGGDGADELFAGYKWYDKFQSRYSQPPLKNWLRKIKGTYQPYANAYQHFAGYNGYFFEEQQKLLLGISNAEALYAPLRRYWQPGFPPALAGQWLDFHGFMPDHCLTKVDRLSMSQGIEVRVPFLDPTLVELVFQIDHAITYKEQERKWLLKSAMQEQLPGGMDWRRKKGFSSPVDSWLSPEFIDGGVRWLQNGSLLGQGLFNPEGLLQVYRNSNANGQLLLLGLEAWSRYWLDGDMRPMAGLDTGSKQ